MVRICESILGGLAAAVFTRNFVIAAVIGVVLFVAWENMDYGVLGRKRDDHVDYTEPTTDDMESEDTDD
jgi:hypothetical protein